MSLLPPRFRGALLLFFVVGAHTLFETTRDALFLERIPAARLPWMYLALACLALVQGLLPRRRAPRDPHQAFLGRAAVGGFAAMAFAALGARLGPAGFYAMYLWGGWFGPLVVSEGWLVVGSELRGNDAKVQLAQIGLGGILGATFGALLARLLLRPEHTTIPLVMVAVLYGGAVLVAALDGRAGATGAATEDTPSTRTSPSPHTQAGGFAGVRDALAQPYPARVAQTVFLSFFALTLLDVFYKGTLGTAVAAEDRTAILASVALAGNVVAALLQIGVARVGVRFLGTIGLALVLPFVLALTTLGWALTGALSLLIAARVIDASMRFSVQRTSNELLLLPLELRVRQALKPLFDVLLQRVAQALASVLVLLLLAYAPRWVAASLLAVACAAWFLSAVAIRAPYKSLFERALRQGILRSGQSVPLDEHGLEVLVASLGSDSDAEVIAALELLDEQRSGTLVPSVVLFHPSLPVVERAAALLVARRRVDALGPLRRLATATDPARRVVGVRGVAAFGGDDRAILMAASHDDVAAVRATALVALVARGENLEELAKSIDIDTSQRENVLAALRAIAASPHPIFARALALSATPHDAEVHRELILAIGALKAPQFLPVLASALARRGTREAARRGLTALGKEAIEYLRILSFDKDTPRGVSLHVPRTLARFFDPSAVEALLALIERHKDGLVRFKALRGLGRIVTRAPRTPVSAKRLEAAIGVAIADTERAHQAFRALRAHVLADVARGAAPGDGASAVGPLVLEYLAARRKQALERIFRLLAIRFPTEDYYRIGMSISAALGSTQVRTNLYREARELLETILRSRQRRPLLTLLISLENDTPAVLRPLQAIAEEVASFGEMGAALAAELADSLPQATPLAEPPANREFGVVRRCVSGTSEAT